MTYLVGVDSGGTHTNVRLVGPSGDLYVIPELDRSLTGNRSDEELRKVIDAVLGAVAGQVRGKSVCMWINAAGYADATRARFESLIKDAAPAIKGRIGIANDAVSLLLANEPELVAIIAGTGSVAMGRCPTGEVVSRGGNEWVVGDYGSAFWIGLNGIRAAYRALEGEPDTALLGCLVEHYRPLGRDEPQRNRTALVQEISRALAALGTSTKPKIASFSQQVTRQAELGDDEAQRIVTEGATELAGAAARVYRELAARAQARSVRPRFLLSGGVAFRSPFYRNTFETSLRRALQPSDDLELDVKVNGLDEATVLASYLESSQQLPAIDEYHRWTVVG